MYFIRTALILSNIMLSKVTLNIGLYFKVTSNWFGSIVILLIGTALTLKSIRPITLRCSKCIRSKLWILHLTKYNIGTILLLTSSIEL